MLMTVTFYAKILNLRDISVNECPFNEMYVSRVIEFEVGVNDSIFSGNEQAEGVMLQIEFHY